MKRRKKATTHAEHLERRLERRVSAGDGPVPVVPYVKFSCPSGCETRNIYSYGKNGRIGYHRCNVCGTVFKSWELDLEAVAKLLPQGGSAE